MSEVNKCAFSVLPTTTEDKQDVITFLRQFFFRDEPLILGIDMLEDIDSLENLQNYCLNFVDNGELKYKILFYKSMYLLGFNVY